MDGWMDRPPRRRRGWEVDPAPPRVRCASVKVNGYRPLKSKLGRSEMKREIFVLEL